MNYEFIKVILIISVIMIIYLCNNYEYLKEKYNNFFAPSTRLYPIV